MPVDNLLVYRHFIKNLPVRISKNLLVYLEILENLPVDWEIFFTHFIGDIWLSKIYP